MDDNRAKAKPSWATKFASAFRGVYVGVYGQSSFAVHLTFAALVVLAAIVLRVGLLEWCLLLLCIALVLTAELLNSALEMLAKAIDDRPNPYLADGLDIASGAVLTASIFAAAVGLVIFLSRLFELFPVW